MGLFSYFSEIAKEIKKSIEETTEERIKELEENLRNEKNKSKKKTAIKMEYESDSGELITKFEKREKVKSFRNLINSINEDNKLKDKKYSYGDEAPSELSDTVKDYDDYVENFQVVNIKSLDEKSKKKTKIRSLKNRENAREAFVNSIIFSRKI